MLRDDNSGVIEMIDAASENARSIAHNLMPPDFARTSFRDVLNNHVAKLNENSDIKFSLYCTDPIHFSKHDELSIYRIIVEITSNVIKHSGALEATIQLIDHGKYLEIMTEDNGSGFDPNANNQGVGMSSIRSRVNYLQGDIRIDSNIKGTTIIIKIPYNNQQVNGKD